MTACGYCFIFVEYCSKKGVLYKIQRGESTALVSAKIAQRNLIVLSYGRIWYTLEDFGLIMVWLSHGLHKIAHGEVIP